MKALRTPHAARFAVLVVVLASATAMAIEEPRFKVLEQQGSFELREYPTYVVAETRVEADFASAGNIAFQRLFGYISGKNVAQQKIAMTAPVTQSRSDTRGEKIAMTAPVSQVADGDAYRVAFHAAGHIHAEDGAEACRPDRADPRGPGASHCLLALHGAMDREQLSRQREAAA